MKESNFHVTGFESVASTIAPIELGTGLQSSDYACVPDTSGNPAVVDRKRIELSQIPCKGISPTLVHFNPFCVLYGDRTRYLLRDRESSCHPTQRTYVADNRIALLFMAYETIVLLLDESTSCTFRQIRTVTLEVLNLLCLPVAP